MKTSSNAASNSLTRDLLSAARYYAGSRIWLVAIASTALGLGAFFNWGWLVAAGIAPLLIGVVPCAAMCALGLCMSGMKGRQPPATTDAAESTGPEAKTDGKNGKDCC